MSNVCGYFMSSAGNPTVGIVHVRIGGRLLGRFSSICSGVKKVSRAAKYIGLPGQPMLDREPGGLNNH